MSDHPFIRIPFNRKEESPASRIEHLLARSVLYGGVSFLLRHPKARQKQLSTPELNDLWHQAVDALAFPEKKEIQDCLDRLMLELAKVSEDEYGRQHESCFGPTVKGRVPVYELEYGQEHSHRQPQELGDIAAFYHAFGLKINAQVHERSDHAAVECEFMHYLTFKESYAWQGDSPEKAEICREASYRFLTDHVGFWLPAFSLRLARHAPTDLMRRMADFIFAFITQDCQSLEIKTGPYDLPIRVVQERQETGCVSCSLSQPLEIPGAEK